MTRQAAPTQLQYTQTVCQLAHDAGALAWVDAVHYAAHEPVDVRAIGADMLICSPGAALPVGPAEDLGQLVQVDVAA